MKILATPLVNTDLTGHVLLKPCPAGKIASGKKTGAYCIGALYMCIVHAHHGWLHTNSAPVNLLIYI